MDWDIPAQTAMIGSIPISSMKSRYSLSPRPLMIWYLIRSIRTGVWKVLTRYWCSPSLLDVQDAQLMGQLYSSIANGRQLIVPRTSIRHTPYHNLLGKKYLLPRDKLVNRDKRRDISLVYSQGYCHPGNGRRPVWYPKESKANKQTIEIMGIVSED